MFTLNKKQLTEFQSKLDQELPKYVLATTRTSNPLVRRVLMQLLLEETAKQIGMPAQLANSCFRMIVQANLKGYWKSLKRVNFYDSGDVVAEYS